MIKENKKTPEIRFPGFTEDWEQRKLGELCERVTRKNKNGASDLPLTIASQYGLIDQRDFFNKVVAAKDMSNYYLLKKGEFAYNKSYSNGFDYGSIKRLNAYEQGCLSTLYICFGITSDDIESDYLECFFDTLKWYSDITMICAEGARNHGLLNVDTKAFFDEVTIEMPTSKEEQKQISTYLNNLDNLITLHQRKCDALQTLKKSMLQKMFPKKGSSVPEIRFPSFTEDWEQRKLNEFAKYSSSPLTVKDTDENGNYDLYDANEPIGKTDKSPLFDDYISIIKDGAGVGRVRKLPKNTSILGTMGALIPQNSDYNFLFSILEKTDFTKLTSGGTIPHIYFKQYGENTYYIPTLAEQTKIGEYFSNLDNLITLHQRKCDTLKELKKGMLQKMFV